MRNFLLFIAFLLTLAKPTTSHALNLGEFVGCMVEKLVGRKPTEIHHLPVIVSDPAGIRYMHTDRSLQDIRNENLYPPLNLEPRLIAGKNILDIPCGRFGRAVAGFKKAGAYVTGVDRDALPAYNENILEGDAQNIPLRSGTVDVIYSTWSYFAEQYERKLPDQFFINVFNEYHRVLKRGGVIRISPVTNIDRVAALALRVPGLTVMIKNERTIYPKNQPPFDAYFLEIRRID